MFCVFLLATIIESFCCPCHCFISLKQSINNLCGASYSVLTGALNSVKFWYKGGKEWLCEIHQCQPRGKPKLKKKLLKFCKCDDQYVLVCIGRLAWVPCIGRFKKLMLILSTCCCNTVPMRICKTRSVLFSSLDFCLYGQQRWLSIKGCNSILTSPICTKKMHIVAKDHFCFVPLLHCKPCVTAWEVWWDKWYLVFTEF